MTMSASRQMLFPLEETRRAWIVYSLAIGVATLVFFSGLASLPFDMDDESYLQDSAAMSKDFSTILSPSHFQGRPMVNLLFWIGHTLWGRSAAAFHLLVVFVHTLASILLARTARRTGAPLEVAWLAGLLFLVNMAHFRAVYWIAAVAYPLALSCSLVAVLCFQRFLDSQRSAWMAGAYLALIVATLSHPAASTAWLFCLFLAWSRGRLEPALRSLAPLGGLLAALVLAMIYFYPETPPVKVAVRFPGVIDLGRQVLWFWSRQLTTAYWLPLPLHRLDNWELVVGALAGAGLGMACWYRRPPATPWAVWALCATLPFITLLPAHVQGLPQGGPSRFIYLASAGAAVLFAWLLRQGALWLTRVNLSCGRLVLALVVSGLMGSSFWALRRAEALSFYSAGRNYISVGSELGIAQLKQAVATRSQVIPLEDAYVRLCLHLLGADEFSTYLAEALHEFPTNTMLNIFKQVAASMGSDAGARQQAALWLEKVLSMTSGAQRQDVASLIAQSYGNMALNFFKRGDLVAAVLAYRQSLALQPSSQAQFNLGLVYLQLGQVEQARQVYAEGIEKYGAAEAQQIGAVDALKQLIGQGIQVAEAQRLLSTYWQ